MLKQLSQRMLKPLARRWIMDEGIRGFGIKNLMTGAKRYNRWLYGDRQRVNDIAFQDSRDVLHVNGKISHEGITIRDGWALDTTGTLPHLEELLRQTDEIIAQRGGEKHSDIQQPFLRNLLFLGDLERYPAFLDFITSSAVLSPIITYLQTVPVLSKTRPPGVRFMESNMKLDPGANGPLRASQLYHLDIHDSPLVYVLVAARDITIDSGPWTFLPASASERATDALAYRERGASYRVTDEQMYRVVDKSEAVSFAYPKGSVLFIDSSRCFHYGSRSAFPPRFLVMYGLTSYCRGDFSQTFMPSQRYPLRSDASHLRRLVCD